MTESSRHQPNQHHPIGFTQHGFACQTSPSGTCAASCSMIHVDRARSYHAGLDPLGRLFGEHPPSTLEGIIIVLQDSCRTVQLSNNGEKSCHWEQAIFTTPNTTLQRFRLFCPSRNIADGTKFAGLEPRFLSHLDRYLPVRSFSNNNVLYHEKRRQYMTIAVALVFVFTAAMFLVYDRLLNGVVNLVMRKYSQTNAINSLFPANVRPSFASIHSVRQHKRKEHSGGSLQEVHIVGAALDDETIKEMMI
jgi:hypothetical protein